MTKKSPAADRTVNMFSGATPVEEREIEVIDNDERGERIPLEQDVDRMRDNAFKGQEWTTKFFGKPEATGNEYRCTKRGEYYYLETLSKKPGMKESYGYTGVMLHENDLLPATSVLVQAIRARNK